VTYITAYVSNFTATSA